VNNTSVRFRALAFGLLALLIPPSALSAYPPALLVGLRSEAMLFSSLDPVAQALAQDAGLRAEGLFSWRVPMGEGGYVALSAQAALDWLPVGVPGWYDVESALLEARLPGPFRFVELSAGVDGSLQGTVEGEAVHLCPDWALRLLLWDDEGRRRLTAGVRGYYLSEPFESEDALYQGGELRYSWAPSVRSRYEVLLEGGWEGWLETPLYLADGSPSGQLRRDLLASAETAVQGLAGYFFDWRLAAELGGRWSNANRYLVPLALLEPDSESRVHAGLRAGWLWSPRRQLSMEMQAFVRQELYLQRDALTSLGELSGEPLWVLSAGGQLRADWTADDRLFLVAEASAARCFANDPAEARWNVQTGLGVQLRL
jgi:hypothetical protein